MEAIDKLKLTKVFCDSTFIALKPLLDVAEFPLLVMDLNTTIMGVVDETAFWMHVAHFGWEQQIVQAINRNFRMIYDKDELSVGEQLPSIDFFIYQDILDRYTIYSHEQMKYYNIERRCEVLQNYILMFEEELNMHKQQNNELKRILHSSYDEIYVTDADGNTLFISESCKKFTGFPPEVFLGRNIRELADKGIVQNSTTLKVMETKTTASSQQIFPNGKTIFATGKPVFNEEGDLSLIITNSRDITELVELRNQLAYTNLLKNRQHKLLTDNQLNTILNRLITHSEKMLPLIELVEKVAQTDSTVLIEGESGVGKSILAKIIHDTSKRKDKNFVLLNCGAIPAALVESELFGYEAGSFTGANNKGKIGLVETANGGTLFLDEIGELPLDVQVKILQLVQEKTFTPVGATKMKKVDIRIISATNKNLKKKIQEKTFREDLYYRLHVVPMVIPPLRERPEDIGLLVDHFIKQFNQKYMQEVTLSESSMRVLESYEWPGNVRELENLTEQLIVTANTSLIHPSDLPPHVLKSNLNDLPEVLISGIIPLNQAVEELEKQIIKRAIKEYGTSRKIAKALQVNQTTVIRKIHKYNLHLSDEEVHDQQRELNNHTTEKDV